MTEFVRAWALDDIRIRSGGDGRTVEAYAAVFDTPTEVHDQDGHYNEVIDIRCRSAPRSRSGRTSGAC
jgi:hypothetical protein